MPNKKTDISENYKNRRVALWIRKGALCLFGGVLLAGTGFVSAQRVAWSDVPQEVVESFYLAHPRSAWKMIQWEFADMGYCARINLQPKEISSLFQANGEWLSTRWTIPEAQLPLISHDFISEKYAFYQLRSCSYEEDRWDGRHYYAQLSIYGIDGYITEICFDFRGNVVSVDGETVADWDEFEPLTEEEVLLKKENEMLARMQENPVSERKKSGVGKTAKDMIYRPQSRRQFIEAQITAQSKIARQREDAYLQQEKSLKTSPDTSYLMVINDIKQEEIREKKPVDKETYENHEEYYEDYGEDYEDDGGLSFEENSETVEVSKDSVQELLAEQLIVIEQPVAAEETEKKPETKEFTVEEVPVVAEQPVAAEETERKPETKEFTVEEVPVVAEQPVAAEETERKPETKEFTVEEAPVVAEQPVAAEETERKPETKEFTVEETPVVAEQPVAAEEAERKPETKEFTIEEAPVVAAQPVTTETSLPDSAHVVERMKTVVSNMQGYIPTAKMSVKAIFPEVVQQAFDRRFPRAENVKQYKDTNGVYRAVFLNFGQKAEAVIFPDGTHTTTALFFGKKDVSYPIWQYIVNAPEKYKFETGKRVVYESRYRQRFSAEEKPKNYYQIVVWIKNKETKERDYFLLTFDHKAHFVSSIPYDYMGTH